MYKKKGSSDGVSNIDSPSTSKPASDSSLSVGKVENNNLDNQTKTQETAEMCDSINKKGHVLLYNR